MQHVDARANHPVPFDRLFGKAGTSDPRERSVGLERKRHHVGLPVGGKGRTRESYYDDFVAPG